MRSSIKICVFLLIWAVSGVVHLEAVASAPTKPKDVVYVLHGLGRSKSAMWLLAARIEDAGFTVKRIGYPSFNQTPKRILKTVAAQIEDSLPEDAPRVHFVGHSLGGLLVRAYLDKWELKNLGRVVLIGTPNHGTTFVDRFRDDWWMKLMGPLPLTLGTDEQSFPNSIGAPYYPVGIIGGVCGRDKNEDTLPGRDDGLVPLESVKLEGMTDMITIASSHSMMRYNLKVANQTIEFLQNGRFKKT